MGYEPSGMRFVARRPLTSLLTAVALAAVAIAVSAPVGLAASKVTQAQTCPVLGMDADSVTLTGSKTLSPPNNSFHSYGITASETAAEKNDGLPHGVTISYAITVIGGDASPANNPDARPPTGSAAGDFATTASFRLRAESGVGVTRTYHIDWMASFDGFQGVSLHTCSSTDGIHSPFTVTVPPGGGKPVIGSTQAQAASPATSGALILPNTATGRPGTGGWTLGWLLTALGLAIFACAAAVLRRGGAWPSGGGSA